jgi:hypothetical protein
MSQNANVVMPLRGTDMTQVGQLTLKPLRSRNGIFEYQGNLQDGTQVFREGINSKFSVSARQGVPADFVKNVQRVKRKVVMKFTFPVEVPGAEGPITDYITVDCSFQAPVEASDVQCSAALSAAVDCTFAGGSPIKELVVLGLEPY